MRRPAPAFAELIPPAGVTRLVLVVAGGLVILQSSQNLDPPKLAYLVVAATAFLFSGRAVLGMRDRPMFVAARPWLLASLLLVGLIGFSLPVALAHGTPITQWVRDAATYGLLAAVPVVALDAASSLRHLLILSLAIATMALGAASYTVYWITARNLAVLPFEHLLLPTASLPLALFVVSLAAAVVHPRRRLAWITLGGLTLGVFLIAGSRSALLFFIAMPVVMAVAGRPAMPRSAVASAGISIVAVVFVVLVQGSFASVGRELAPPMDVGPSASPLGTSPGTSPGASPVASPTAPPTPHPTADPEAALIPRLQAFLTSPERDGSIRERVAQYGVAWDLFVSSPLVGVGLGHPFAWVRVDGTTKSDITADTPLVMPAKFGVLGIAWLGLFIVAWVRFLRTLRRAAGVTIPTLAMTGWAAVLVALAWGSFILEDKGFSFALMLLLSLAFVEIERAVASDAG